MLLYTSKQVRNVLTEILLERSTELSSYNLLPTTKVWDLRCDFRKTSLFIIFLMKEINKKTNPPKNVHHILDRKNLDEK